MSHQLSGMRSNAASRACAGVNALPDVFSLEIMQILLIVSVTDVVEIRL
ncbi:MAG: hypothetical protein ABI277_00225 [Burkholderiaceae bacterium]